MTAMLRTLARSVAVWVAATGLNPRSLSSIALRPVPAGPVPCCRAWCSRRALPAVVRERLVGLGHLVGVLAALHARPEAVARVKQLVHEPLGHRLLAALPGVGHDPAQRQRGAAGGTDLDRHLVGRATDPAAADLQRRLH